MSLQNNYIYILSDRTIRKFSPTIIERYFWNDPPLSIRSRSTEKTIQEFPLQSLFIPIVNKC